MDPRGHSRKPDFITPAPQFVPSGWTACLPNDLSMVLMAVVVAAYLPARRAGRAEPQVLLRQ